MLLGQPSMVSCRQWGLALRHLPVKAAMLRRLVRGRADRVLMERVMVIRRTQSNLVSSTVVIKVVSNIIIVVKAIIAVTIVAAVVVVIETIVIHIWWSSLRLARIKRCLWQRRNVIVLEILERLDQVIGRQDILIFRHLAHYESRGRSCGRRSRRRGLRERDRKLRERAMCNNDEKK